MGCKKRRSGGGNLPIDVELKVLVMRSAAMESSLMSWMISGDRAWMSIIEKLRQQVSRMIEVDSIHS